MTSKLPYEKEKKNDTNLPRGIRSLPDRSVLGGEIVVGAQDVVGAEIERSGARSGRPSGGSTRCHEERDRARGKEKRRKAVACLRHQVGLWAGGDAEVETASVDREAVKEGEGRLSLEPTESRVKMSSRDGFVGQLPPMRVGERKKGRGLEVD